MDRPLQTTRDRWTITRLGFEDLEALTGYMKRENHGSHPESLPGWWEWKYLDNPVNGDDDPAVFLLKHDRSIHGFVAASSSLLWIGGGVYPFYRVEKFDTDERGRGRGALLARAIKGLPNMAGGFSNDRALRLWRRLARPGTFMELFHPSILQLDLERTASPHRFPLTLFGRRGTRTTALARQGVSIIRIERFETRWEKQLRALHNGYPVTPFRTISSLNWRYFTSGYEKHLVWAVIDEDGACLGFAVLGISLTGQGELGIVQDLLNPAGRPEIGVALIERMIGAGRSRGLKDLKVFDPCLPPVTNLFLDSGFQRAEQYLHLTFIIHRKPDQISHELIASGKNWYIPGEMIA